MLKAFFLPIFFLKILSFKNGFLQNFFSFNKFHKSLQNIIDYNQKCNCICRSRRLYNEHNNSNCSGYYCLKLATNDSIALFWFRIAFKSFLLLFLLFNFAFRFKTLMFNKDWMSITSWMWLPYPYTYVLRPFVFTFQIMQSKIIFTYFNNEFPHEKKITAVFKKQSNFGNDEQPASVQTRIISLMT